MLLTRLLTSPKYLGFCNRVFHVQFTADHLAVQRVGAPSGFADAPYVALNQKQQIVAIGVAAEAVASELGSGARLVRVFAHPRVLIAEPLIAGLMFRYAFSKAERPWIWITSLDHFIPMLRPIVIVHPQRNFEPTLTPAEVQTVHTSLVEAHARRVYVWTGEPLTEHEILSGAFPGDHWYDARPPWIAEQRKPLF